jgi:hypothetical protein
MATMLAKVTADPANYTVSFQGANVMLGFQASWGFNLNDIPGLALDTAVTLNIAAGELAALQELSLVLKIDTL